MKEKILRRYIVQNFEKTPPQNFFNQPAVPSVQMKSIFWDSTRDSKNISKTRHLTILYHPFILYFYCAVPQTRGHQDNPLSACAPAHAHAHAHAHV